MITRARCRSFCPRSSGDKPKKDGICPKRGNSKNMDEINELTFSA